MISLPIALDSSIYPCQCGANVGELHVLGCATETCPVCGYQYITCLEHAFISEDYELVVVPNGPAYPRIRWTGDHTGVSECHEYGLFAVINDKGPGWVSVPAGTPGSSPDLNTLLSIAKWDKKLARFVIPKPL